MKSFAMTWLSRDNMHRWWWGLILLGAVLRVLSWSQQGGIHYPDEIFQQLEPAQHLRTGLSWLPWEFGRGLRPWIFPWLYAGLLEIAHWFGLEGLAAYRALGLHNALWTTTMVPAGWKMGRAMVHGDATEAAKLRDVAGICAAALAASWPMLLFFAPHTLMGTPSMVCLAWGWAHWVELRKDSNSRSAALWMGFFFGLAGMARFTSGLHMLIPLLDLLLRRRWRSLGWVVTGSMPGVLLLGVVDWITWGRPFHSAIEHITYNYFEDGASHHGTSPWHTYLTEALAGRFGLALPLSLLWLLLALTRAWPLLLTVGLPTLLLSTVAHKEERFLMHNWPAITAAMGLGAAITWRWMHKRLSTQISTAITVLLLLATLGAGLQGARQLDWRWKAGIFEGQEWVRLQPDATGVLFEERQHLSGGYTIQESAVPLVSFRRSLIRNPVFNYAIVYKNKAQAPWLLRQGWTQETTLEQGVLVLKRPKSK